MKLSLIEHCMSEPNQVLKTPHGIFKEKANNSNMIICTSIRFIETAKSEVEL